MPGTPKGGLSLHELTFFWDDRKVKVVLFYITNKEKSYPFFFLVFRFFLSEDYGGGVRHLFFSPPSYGYLEGVAFFWSFSLCLAGMPWFLSSKHDKFFPPLLGKGSW